MPSTVGLPEVTRLLRELDRGDPADIDSSTAAEIKDALSRCREAVLLGRVADLAPLKMITSLYQRLLSVPVRGSPASRHVDGAQVALFCAALGDSNAALRSQVVTAWISGMSPADASCQLEQCAADMMRDAARSLESWRRDACRADMPRQALLADVLRQADDVYSCAFLLNEAASDGAAPLQAVLEAALLLYTEVLPRIMGAVETGPAVAQQWGLIHSACRRILKAVWQVLCPRWREDAARTAARVDRAVNLLLQTEPAGTPLLTSLQASALSALRAAVADPRGWRAMPAVLTAAPLTEAVLRDLCMVYGHELRALLLQTVCAPEDSTGAAAREDAEQRADYMLSCFAGTGDAEGGLLMLSLRRQQGSGRTEGHGGGKVAEPLAVQPENGVSDGMEALRQMFPDCGDVFLGACLRAFDMSPERTIDALLSENLPPEIARMDRKTKVAWVGKAATDMSLHIPSGKSSGLRGSATVFVPAMEEKERQAMHARVRALEQSHEEDARVIAAEYGDDYDDQFDDPTELSHIGMSAGGGDLSADIPAVTAGVIGRAARDKPTALGAASGPTTKSIRRAKKEKEREQNMARGGKVDGGSLRGVGSAGVEDVKRFNSLLRGQEDEEAFWEGMKNTNVKKERRGFEAESESEDGDSGTPEPTKPDAAVRPAGPNRNAANSAGSAKTGGSAPGAPVPVAGDKKKHNSRKFDRHHQKDRSTRKFGV